MNNEKCTERKDGFNQVCIWTACTLNEGKESTPKKIEDFEKFMFENFGVRVQFLEEIETAPDTDKLGNPVRGTGGRIDLLFAVHKDDIGKFAVKRLMYEIHWIEDSLSKDAYTSPIYPKRVGEYITWNHKNIAYFFDVKEDNF